MSPRRKGSIGVTIVATALGLATWSSSSVDASNRPVSHVNGANIAIYAEEPSTIPNFIFPFMTSAYFSEANTGQFQYLMYRPLYFFGSNGKPTVNTSLSLADYPPKFTNRDTTVTVTLKNYRWSNGERVSAQDVVFWMNFMKTEKLLWAGYVPGGIPDDIASISTPNQKTVVFKLTHAVNRDWWTYNELSQITPIPMAWDVTSAKQRAGAQPCGTASYKRIVVKEKGAGTPSVAVRPVNSTARNCVAVFNYLSSQAGFNPTNPRVTIDVYAMYAKSKLWRVVDGPWRLAKFQSNGYAVFEPNPKYSGPVKAKLAEFIETPYSAGEDEFNALAGGAIDVGYLPTKEVTSDAKGPTTPGANNPQLQNSFAVGIGASWEVNYIPLNFNSTENGGTAGKLISQRYLRQALQLLVNQPSLIKTDFKGYGYPTYGPVPIYPSNPYASQFEESNPYPYDPAKAVSLLRANGWTIHPGGTDTCRSASECGVPKGTPLSLDLQYASGNLSITEEVAAEDATWRAAGINVNLSYDTFAIVIGNVRCSGPSCTWGMVDSGGGWFYQPDYYPSGESLFESTATSNTGSYSSSKMDSLIKSTVTTSTPLTAYENYAATQVPVIWEPVQSTPVEVQKTLHGVFPINPLGNITPENWYFTK